MPRSLDDDAPNRLNTADQQVPENERARLEELRCKIRAQERLLATWERTARVHRAAAVVSLIALLVGGSWTAFVWGEPERFIVIDAVCGALLLSAVVGAVIATRNSPMATRGKVEDELEALRDELRFRSAVTHPSLAERRSLYREDVAGVVEQFQRESRRYRRVHHSLQSLIMIGSLSTSTVTALDTGSLTWQQVVTIIISFAVAVAAAFTGYFKYRERSFYLQQTADDIEAEAHALTLQIGEYENDAPDKALGRFAKRVEALRNEQRRRQQQLDQPTDQGATAQQPPV